MRAHNRLQQRVLCAPLLPNAWRQGNHNNRVSRMGLVHVRSRNCFFSFGLAPYRWLRGISVLSSQPCTYPLSFSTQSSLPNTSRACTTSQIKSPRFLL
jgi:hypothetical protein